MKVLVFILNLIISFQVLAGVTRSVQADQIRSADKTKTFTLPGSSDTLVGRDSTDTLTNKTISGSSNTFSNIDITSAITGALPIANGGTGETTAQAAIDALLPDQFLNNGKVLGTNGTTASWVDAGGSGANTSLSNLSAVDIGGVNLGGTGDITPDTDGTEIIGANTSEYLRGYIRELYNTTNNSISLGLNTTGQITFHQSILPNANGTLDFGSTNFAVKTIFVREQDGTNDVLMNFITTAGASMMSVRRTLSAAAVPDGISYNNSILTGLTGETFAVITNSSSNATTSGSINFLTGNNSSTGATGDIQLRTGVPTSGTRGKIALTSRLTEANSGIKPVSLTADPCADATAYPEGTLFYNDTSDYFCFCNGAGNDVQFHSPATACF